jgi:hypothetical protein
MLPYTAVKATLTGDYSHKQKAWTKTFDHITEQKLSRNMSQGIVEVHSKNIEDEKQPSKWVTEIYVPVYQKVAPRKPTNVKPADSTNAVVPAVPSENTTP